MRRILPAIALLLVSLAAWSQSFPQRSIKIIVPYPAGGSSDMFARLVVPKMSETLGQPVVVENRAGAGGVVGVEAAVKSPADGYTLVMPGPGALTILPHLTKLPFSLNDFAYLAVIGRVPQIVTVNAKLGINSLDELVKAAKQSPGKLNYASAGNGSSLHLAGALLAQELNITIVHVPYKGIAQALTDLVGGQVQILVGNANAVLPQIKGGALKGLAVTSTKRLEQLPSMPSVVDLGLKNLVAEDVWGLAVPVKTPAPIVERLQQAVAGAVRSREVTDKVLEQAAIPGPSTPEDYRQWAQSELDRWGKVIQAGHITLE